MFLLAFLAQASLAGAQTKLNLPIAPGPFKPTMESLKQYECPTWFRDAKFGIWAHWGPQAVPMDGDWYARGMYEPGNGHYKYHLDHYGHPTKFGYKDIIPLWKAEKWDPDRLMQLYKKAGAKYFVSMGSHHDDFFLWNSKLHRWNAAIMGPHKDVVGTWQKAATKYGLKFGVSEHLGASFTWFQSSHRSDTEGPLKGVPYDGADPVNWDLYHFPALPGDTGWYSNNPRWQQQWFNEISELVDNYHPDLLYSDGGVPFGNEVGRSMIAHFYNANAAAHGGKVQAIYNCKQTSDGRWVEDLERGIMGKIDAHPWQTDTSIGDWFYNRNWEYRPLKWVVHTLVDNVSKNGNLLLNVVQRPDGSLDPIVEQMLGQMADWTAVHGEAIFGSRPWQVYGEGTVKARGGSFREDYTYSAKDIRFTTKGSTLYALALGWPTDNRLTIRSLASMPGKNQISNIQLLGYHGRLTWSQGAEGLTVQLPVTKVSELTCGLKITGRHLNAVIQPDPVPTVVASDGGALVLSAELAQMHGEQIKVEDRTEHSNIGFWDHADEWPFWMVSVSKPGRYRVVVRVAGPNASSFVVEGLGEPIRGTAPNTGDWGEFRDVDLGVISLDSAGMRTVTLKAANPSSWKAINVESIVLKPVP